MKIATWNIERLKHQRELAQIEKACEELNADILVLTESDERVRLDYRYCSHTPTPPDFYLPRYKIPFHYEETEHRVSVYTNYECVCQHSTFDEHTALCAELLTERGNLLVCGTIMGVVGNREASYKKDLSMQIRDFKRLSAAGHSLCILGDYNCSFSDNYYYTNEGRNMVLSSFAESNIRILSKDKSECIDHIAISDCFINGAAVQVEEWNCRKFLSDHKGTAVTLQWDK